MKITPTIMPIHKTNKVYLPYAKYDIPIKIDVIKEFNQNINNYYLKMSNIPINYIKRIAATCL